MTGNHITQANWDGNRVVAVHVSGAVLIMSEADFSLAITRGKQWKSWQASDKRMRQRQAEDEAAQLAFLDDEVK